MRDIFDYTSPLRPVGTRSRIIFFLENYMRNLLAERNAVIKQLAESPAHKIV